MAKQADVETEKNLPHGINEGVPVRTSTGKENNHPANPLDDGNTKIRRARYGENPAFETPTRDTAQAMDGDINDVKPKRNREMREDLQHTDMASRAMCQ